jgi:TM2 domain-containing membrane protein YozV
MKYCLFCVLYVIYTAPEIEDLLRKKRFPSMEHKDKNVAAVLAFFLGTFGVHRFYLGQIWLGILHCIFMATTIPTIVGFIDAMVLLSMDKERFEEKYNRKKDKRKSRKRKYERDYEEDDYYEEERERGDRRRDRDRYEDKFERRRYSREREIESWERRQRRREREASRQRRDDERQQERRQRREEVQKMNTFRSEGIRRFKEFDYDGAIECFERVLDLDNTDVAAHFNLACAHSLNEEVEGSLDHLDKAVKNGFDDFQKIRSHDALAYVRIHPEFDQFVERGFRLTDEAPEPQKAAEDAFVPSPPPRVEAPKDDLLQSQPDLLDQLQKLGELKERGLLTEEQFTSAKRKLLD